MSIPNAIERVLLDEETIAARVRELAARISADYTDADDLVLVGVLKGAFIFMADLSRYLEVVHHVDFIALSSYNRSAVSTGAVRLIMDVRASVTGRPLPHAALYRSVEARGIRRQVSEWQVCKEAEGWGCEMI